MAGRNAPSAIGEAQAAIVYHARHCENSLRAADFAAGEPSLGTGIATSLHKQAVDHSAQAFRWARHLRPSSGVPTHG